MQKSELFRQELLPLNESLYNFAYHLTYRYLASTLRRQSLP